MVRSCSVPHCKNTGGFSFPADKRIRRQWLVAIRREGKDESLWKPGIYSTVCHSHFKPEDYTEALYAAVSANYQPRRKYLKKTAVPSLFSWNSSVSDSKLVQGRDRPQHDQRGRQFEDGHRDRGGLEDLILSHHQGPDDQVTDVTKPVADKNPPKGSSDIPTMDKECSSEC